MYGEEDTADKLAASIGDEVDSLDGETFSRDDESDTDGVNGVLAGTNTPLSKSDEALAEYEDVAAVEGRDSFEITSEAVATTDEASFNASSFVPFTSLALVAEDGSSTRSDTSPEMFL